MLSSTKTLACLLLISLTICTKPSKAQNVYKPLTPAEWALRFRCDANATSTATEATGDREQCQRTEPEGPNYCPREEDVCSRHHGDWMWKYADELNPEFQVLVKEKSIDERLANIIYATITTREFDMEFQKFAANDPSLEQYFEQLVVGPQVNYDLCGAHLRSMLGLFDEYRHKLDLARQENKSSDLDEKYIRLARVLDSNGRYLSGTLSGKIVSPGAYEQCINSQLSLLDDSTLVGMRFCLAGLSLEPNLSHELRLRKRFDHERSALAFHVALCLPESCHSKSLMHHRQLIQRWLEIEFKFPSSIYLHETANVTILHCMVDKQSPMGLPTSGKLLIGVVSAWLMLVSYATYRTCARKSKHNITLIVQHDKRPPVGLEMEQTKRRQTWESCLSVVNNWKDFMEVKDDHHHHQQKPFVIDLDVLNPIKVIACVWATLVHAFIAIHIGSNNLLRDHKLIESDHNMGLVIVSPLVVETYFVISGVLTTYLALKRVDKYEQSKSEATTWGSSSLSSSLGLRQAYRNFLELLKKCLVLIVGRYLRLLPLFYLAFWFKKGIFQYIGSAPLWNFGFNKDSGGQCRNESWWSPLSLASVYDPILRKCIPQSYTITTDMIFIIISAPLISLINKYQRTVVALMVSVGFCSFLASLAEFVRTNKSIVWNMADYKSYGMLQMLSTPLSYIYTSPEYRLFSVFFGIIVGWLVYRYDHKVVSGLQMVTNDTKRSNSMASHSQWLWRLVTLFAFTFPFLISLLATFRLEFKSLFRPYHRTLFPYYFMSAKILWALSSAIVLLRLLTDWGQSGQVAWMKSKFWRILAKLNYSVLLIHLDLLLLDWQIQTNETVASKYKIISTLTFAHSASIFIGMLVYVLVENPIDKLVKRYII